MRSKIVKALVTDIYVCIYEFTFMCAYKHI